MKRGELIMPVGRYEGKRVETLPHSYLRWIVTQDFTKEILDCAKKQLSESTYSDLDVNVSRHAMDMFSKRFLFKWVSSTVTTGSAKDCDGIATYVAKLAQEAWEKGVDVSKDRHADDGVMKLYSGIKWVFGTSKNFPEYIDVITVMEDNS